MFFSIGVVSFLLGSYGMYIEGGMEIWCGEDSVFRTRRRACLFRCYGSAERAGGWAGSEKRFFKQAKTPSPREDRLRASRAERRPVPSVSEGNWAERPQAEPVRAPRQEARQACKLSV